MAGVTGNGAVPGGGGHAAAAGHRRSINFSKQKLQPPPEPAGMLPPPAAAELTLPATGSSDAVLPTPMPKRGHATSVSRVRWTDSPADSDAAAAAAAVTPPASGTSSGAGTAANTPPPPPPGTSFASIAAAAGAAPAPGVATTTTAAENKPYTPQRGGLRLNPNLKLKLSNGSGSVLANAAAAAGGGSGGGGGGGGGAPSVNVANGNTAAQNRMSYKYSDRGSLLLKRSGIRIGQRGLRAGPHSPVRGSLYSSSAAGAAGQPWRAPSGDSPIADNLVRLEELGHGASGCVYKAVHATTLKLLAVKEVPLHDKGRRNQVGAEIKTLLANRTAAAAGNSGGGGGSSSNNNSPALGGGGGARSTNNESSNAGGGADANANGVGTGANSGANSNSANISNSSGGCSTGGELRGVVAFYDAFISPGSGCVSIVMEYCGGGSLQDLIAAVGPLDPATVASVAADALAGLGYIHRQRKLHRDIKPGNLLLDDHGSVRLADFGLVRDLSQGADEVVEVSAGGRGGTIGARQRGGEDEEEAEQPRGGRGGSTAAHTFVGTAVYMSPERLRGEPYGFASDVWSLGLSLLTLALGRFPLDVPRNNLYWHLVKLLCPPSLDAIDGARLAAAANAANAAEAASAAAAAAADGASGDAAKSGGSASAASNHQQQQQSQPPSPLPLVQQQRRCSGENSSGGGGDSGANAANAAAASTSSPLPAGPIHLRVLPEPIDVFLPAEKAAALNLPENFLDLLRKCLRRDPEQRPSVEELLTHPFVTQPLPPSLGRHMVSSDTEDSDTAFAAAGATAAATAVGTAAIGAMERPEREATASPSPPLSQQQKQRQQAKAGGSSAAAAAAALESPRRRFSPRSMLKVSRSSNNSQSPRRRDGASSPSPSVSPRGMSFLRRAAGLHTDAASDRSDRERSDATDPNSGFGSAAALFLPSPSPSPSAASAASTVAAGRAASGRSPGSNFNLKSASSTSSAAGISPGKGGNGSAAKAAAAFTFADDAVENRACEEKAAGGVGTTESPLASSSGTDALPSPAWPRPSSATAAAAAGRYGLPRLPVLAAGGSSSASDSGTPRHGGGGEGAGSGRRSSEEERLEELADICDKLCRFHVQRLLATLPQRQQHERGLSRGVTAAGNGEAAAAAAAGAAAAGETGASSRGGSGGSSGSSDGGQQAPATAAGAPPHAHHASSGRPSLSSSLPVSAAAQVGAMPASQAAGGSAVSAASAALPSSLSTELADDAYELLAAQLGLPSVMVESIAEEKWRRARQAALAAAATAAAAAAAARALPQQQQQPQQWQQQEGGVGGG